MATSCWSTTPESTTDISPMNTQSEPAPTAAVLRTEHLGRRVGHTTIVGDISLGVRHGELMGIVGPSGSGKSSLLRLMNRLDEPTSGTVYVEGVDYKEIAPRELRRKLSMVTQRPYLFPGTVEENLRFGPLQRGEALPAGEIAKLLDRVGLSGYGDR